MFDEKLKAGWPALLLVPYAALVYRFWFLCDDAYITFRYSRNLARADGLTFNAGEAPVEGYSNFLWMMIAAGFESVLADTTFWMPLLSALTGAALVAYIHETARLHLGLSRAASITAAAIAGTAAPFAIWATSGLATMPFALLVFAFFERTALAKDRWAAPLGGLAGVLLMTVRTEGIAWIAVIAVLAIAARVWDARVANGPDKPLDFNVAKPVVMALVAVGVAFVIYTGWRYSHFGHWLPNTAHAKVGMSADRLLRGGKYVGLFWVTCFTQPLLLAGAVPVIRWRQGAGSAIALMAVAFPAYAVVVGGDFMPMGRMILPSVAFVGLLGGALVQFVADNVSREGTTAHAALGLGLGALLVGAGLLPSFDAHVVGEGARSALHFRLSDKEFMSEYRRWRNMRDNTEGFSLRGEALAMVLPPDARVVSQAIGVVGYHTDVFMYDQYGLVNREVALLPAEHGPLSQSPGHDKFVKAGFFAKYDPDVLHSRVVRGPMSTRLMHESLEKWDVPEELRTRYVPEYMEVELDGAGDRAFFLMVRRAKPSEKPLVVWETHKEERKRLAVELRQYYLDNPKQDDANG